VQDISDEDCIAEASFEWLIDWARKNAPDYEYQHWIYGADFDQSYSYCLKCCKKEVKKLQKKYPEEYISVDGGFSQESESPVFCHLCGKPLEYDFVDTFGIKEYLDIPIKLNKSNAYLIDNTDEYDLLKTKDIHRLAFEAYWKKKYGTHNWETNPYIWVYEFKHLEIEKPET
jgi:hypothetical protein